MITSCPLNGYILAYPCLGGCGDSQKFAFTNSPSTPFPDSEHDLEASPLRMPP